MSQDDAMIEAEQDLFFDQRFLINKIKFFKNIISLLRKNLEMMVKYTVSEECMHEVEQYQNKFIVYSEVGDRLIKELKLVRNKIREMDSSGDGTDRDAVIKFNNSVTKRSKEYFSFINNMSEDFMMFYSAYHKTDNHIF